MTTSQSFSSSGEQNVSRRTSRVYPLRRPRGRYEPLPLRWGVDAVRRFPEEARHRSGCARRAPDRRPEAALPRGARESRRRIPTAS